MEVAPPLGSAFFSNFDKTTFSWVGKAPGFLTVTLLIVEVLQAGCSNLIGSQVAHIYVP
jgi:hypothetical protein